MCYPKCDTSVRKRDKKLYDRAFAKEGPHGHSEARPSEGAYTSFRIERHGWRMMRKVRKGKTQHVSFSWIALVARIVARRERSFSDFIVAPLIDRRTMEGMDRKTRLVCDCCGACCKTFPVLVSIGDAHREPRVRAEGRHVPDWQRTEEWTYQLHPLPFLSSCCFLRSDNHCDVYETRPDVCRRFTAGSAECTEARERVGLQPLAYAFDESRSRERR